MAVPGRHGPFPNSRSRGSPVLAKAAGLLPGSSDSASPADRRCTIVADALVPAFRVERSACHRNASDFRPLASQGFQTVLALEVAGRSAPAPQGHTPAHRPDGKREHNLGTRAHRRELSLKLGILVSPRTVGKYWPKQLGGTGRTRTSSQHWRTFVRNHAQGIVACDFLVAVTARFRVLYVFVMMEIGSRRVLHYNVTAHPTAEWTLQQLREAIPSDHPYQFFIHDRDSIFSRDLDEELKSSFGLRVLRTPVRAPKANAYCERLIGTVRRECLDFMIPLNERHLRRSLQCWITHYNKGRPHSSLGPGFPEKTSDRPRRRPTTHRHRLPRDCEIRVMDVLGGLHHEYWLDEVVA